MASGSKAPAKKASKCPRNSEFDWDRFVSFVSHKVLSVLEKLEDDDASLTELDVQECLSSKAVIEITDDVFKNNDFGIQICLLLVALTKWSMPTVNTKHKLVGVDKHVVYRILNDDQVDFVAIVLNWIQATGDLFCSEHYASRTKKATMPFGSIITVIFIHHKVDISKEVVVPVPHGHEISDSTLKAIHYIKTINREWILFSYLREDDQVHHGARLPTPEERITRRGPETLRVLQTGTFLQKLQSKGKKIVVERHIDQVDDDLVARMQSLETTQLKLHDDVRAVRTEVTEAKDDIRSVKNILKYFIRSFPFPSSSSVPTLKSHISIACLEQYFESCGVVLKLVLHSF